MQDISKKYRRILEAHLKDPSERRLFEAYEFGKECMEQDIPIAQIIKAHFNALINIDFYTLEDDLLQAQRVLLEITTPMTLGDSRESLENVLVAMYDENVRELLELKKAKENLKKSEGFLKNILESIGDGLLVIGSDKKIELANSASARLLAMPFKDMIGRFYYDVLPYVDATDHGPGEEGMVQKTFQTGAGQISQHRFDRDGERMFFVLHSYPMKNEDGRTESVIIVLTDITNTKKMEDQLLKTQKMTTVAGLAAGVAHEINTPLSAILQSIQIIEQGLSPDLPANQEIAAQCNVDLAAMQKYFRTKEIDFFLNGARNSAENAAIIIKSLLEFSRPHKGDITYTNPVQLLDNAVSLARADYNLKKKYDILNVEVVREYAPDLPNLPCVAMEIQQVVLNLIKNAVQAMIVQPADFPCPQIILRASQQGETLHIEVEDNGPGMSEEVRNQIFDPFFTTKDVGIGTGLGLSVSHSIICDKHGGNLWVESKPGRGARFVVELPLHPQ